MFHKCNVGLGENIGKLSRVTHSFGYNDPLVTWIVVILVNEKMRNCYMIEKSLG